MRLGLYLPDYSRSGGPGRLGATLAEIARAADECEFELIGVPDHVWQHPYMGGTERAFEVEDFRLDRPLNSPQSLTRPHPPIMIGGAGERKTLRMAARYADACNLYPTPELPRKLDVLRRHCAEEGRDYDTIEKTCMLLDVDVGRMARRSAS